jgi:HAD superfamily hydrolase (TIGR01509 family)
MTNVRAVAFDVDGCLVDTDTLHFDALNHALMLCRAMPISPEEHAATYKGLPTSVKLDMLIAAGSLAPTKRATIEAIKRETTREALARLPPSPDAVALVAQLHDDGIPLCAVSNAIRESVAAMLTAAGVADYLRFYLGNEDAAPKPAPDLYLLAAKMLGIAPHELVVVEDGAPGIAAATAAGCRVVRVNGPQDVTLAHLWPRIVEG